jgi:hypothetical protein
MIASSVLLAKSVYTAAIQSAEAKDRTINYRKLQADPSIILIYNPLTKDGIFTSRLGALSYKEEGYYPAWPHVRYAQTLAENNANLKKYGWPKWEGI